MLSEREELLLQKSVAGRISEAEAAEVRELMKNPEFREAFELENSISSVLARDAEEISRLQPDQPDPAFLRTRPEVPLHTQEPVSGAGGSRLLRGFALLAGLSLTAFLLFFMPEQEKPVQRSRTPAVQSPPQASGVAQDEAPTTVRPPEADSSRTDTARPGVHKNARPSANQVPARPLQRDKNIPVLTDDTVKVPIHIRK